MLENALPLLSIPHVSLPSDAVVIVGVGGQSNQIGTLAYASQIPFPVPWDDISSYAFIWSKIGLSSYLNPTNDGAWVPLTVGFGISNGVDAIGPEMSLAWYLHQVFRRPIYIVKWGRGATPLAIPPGGGWTFDPTATGGQAMWPLWRNFYWGPALTALRNMVGTNRIHCVGFDWLQGAADATGAIPGSHTAYAANLTAFIGALRALISPDLAVSIGLSENFQESPLPLIVQRHPHIVPVRTAQTTVASTLPDCALVNNDTRERIPGVTSFPRGSDGEHWNGIAQVQRGIAMGARLVGINSIVFGPGGAT